MKCRYYILLFCAVLGLVGSARAENTNLVDDLVAVVAQVNAKLSSGKAVEQDFADDLKKFDDLHAKYKGDQSEASELLLVNKATIYEVFGEYEKAAAVYRQFKTDFPGTKFDVDARLAELQRVIDKQNIRRALVPGVKAPEFDEKDIYGKPFSIASRKGKVVLIDFWATWCAACVQEMPDVIDIYDKYHDQGLEILGVSMDVNKPKLDAYLIGAGVKWPQFFDGQYWDNKLAAQYGVDSAPTTYLLDRDGKIIAVNLPPQDLDAAVAKALKQ